MLSSRAKRCLSFDQGHCSCLTDERSKLRVRSRAPVVQRSETECLMLTYEHEHRKGGGGRRQLGAFLCEIGTASALVDLISD